MSDKVCDACGCVGIVLNLGVRKVANIYQSKAMKLFKLLGWLLTFRASLPQKVSDIGICYRHFPKKFFKRPT